MTTVIYVFSTYSPLQPQDLLETHIGNLEFYVSLVSWIIANEELYPGQMSMAMEFETAYRHLNSAIRQLDHFVSTPHLLGDEAK